jgi:histone deacetylase complex regulatory component SIN3
MSESVAESAPSPGLNVTDAQNYLDTLRTQLADNPNDYNTFLDLMSKFKAGK